MMLQLRMHLHRWAHWFCHVKIILYGKLDVIYEWLYQITVKSFITYYNMVMMFKEAAFLSITALGNFMMPKINTL